MRLGLAHIMDDELGRVRKALYSDESNKYVNEIDSATLTDFRMLW